MTYIRAKAVKDTTVAAMLRHVELVISEEQARYERWRKRTDGYHPRAY